MTVARYYSIDEAQSTIFGYVGKLGALAWIKNIIRTLDGRTPYGGTLKMLE